MSETTWRWLSASAVFAVHDRQLSEHGGADAIRDPGAIESALSRPENLAAYGSPDAADLAAAYAYGIVRNHGFVDGNKRTAWVAARVFLADNGYRLAFDRQDAVRIMESLAGGQMSEEDLAQWFRHRLDSA